MFYVEYIMVLTTERRKHMTPRIKRERKNKRRNINVWVSEELWLVLQRRADLNFRGNKTMVIESLLSYLKETEYRK